MLSLIGAGGAARATALIRKPVLCGDNTWTPPPSTAPWSAEWGQAGGKEWVGQRQVSQEAATACYWSVSICNRYDPFLNLSEVKELLISLRYLALQWPWTMCWANPNTYTREWEPISKLCVLLKMASAQALPNKQTKKLRFCNLSFGWMLFVFLLL